MRSSKESYDVLVVGAGPAGLTTAITLARAGVRVLVVDKHAGTSIFPKATGIRLRTMEILRSWGLEQQVREGAQQVRLAVAVSSTLADPRQQELSFGVPAPHDLQTISPSTVAICPQDHLEPVLLEHLVCQRGEVRFRTELIGFSMGDGGVTARLRPRHRHGDTATDNATYEIRARYIVGADGSKSAVREVLGIQVEQLGFEGEHLAVLFRADLASVIAGHAYALHFVVAPGAEGMFVPSGTGGRWVYDLEWHPERGDSLTDWSPERCVEAIRAAAGVSDLEPEILRIFPWSFGAAVATAHRAGNGFLVGDAAHRTTPRGAMGMNTAIAAGHNLGWKLAWVIRGWAGESLLDSYEAERGPVGLRNALRSLETDDEDDGEPLADDFGVVYSSRVIVPDGTLAPTPGQVVLDARPGSRAPHAWVDVDGDVTSTLDLFDGRLTVLTGPQGLAWQPEVEALRKAGLPIALLAFGRDLPDPDGSLADLYGIGASGAAVVRPDGHIAWRLAVETPSSRSELRQAVETALGRRHEPPHADLRADRSGWPAPSPSQARRQLDSAS